MPTWYTRQELSKRFAFFYTGPAVANIFGGLIAAGVLGNLHGRAGLESWRWLFVIESLMTTVVTAVAFLVLPNFPATTPWLTKEERAYTI